MTDTQLWIAAGVAVLVVLLLLALVFSRRKRGAHVAAPADRHPAHEPEVAPTSAPALPDLPKHTTWAEDADLLSATELPVRTAEQIAAEAGPADEANEVPADDSDEERTDNP